MTQTVIELIYIAVGKRIQQERKTRHITQGDLAARVGLSDAGHLSAIELGKQRVQLHKNPFWVPTSIHGTGGKNDVR